jgi:hypothetical protein
MLSKKRSRPIVVDQQEYRWSIADDGQYVTLAIQLLEANGQRLEAAVETDLRRYWLETPMNARTNTQPSKWRPVTPSLVAKIIKNGLALGWTPGRKLPPLEVSLNAGDELELRRGLKK